MATAFMAPAVAAHTGLSHATSITNNASTHATKEPRDVSSTSGFKVYGSLFKVDARYQFLNPLGKGSYGVVCAARDRETGVNIAIKKVAPMAKRTVDAKHTLREVLLLQLLGRHPNIISIHNLSVNLKDDELYIVMDLMDTDLHRVIQSAQALSDAHVKYFLHQLLRGVKYLHDNNVLHRDLKPGNLLLSKTCHLKIADFGLARKATQAHSTSSNTAPLERPRSAPASASASSSSSTRAPMTEHVVTRWYRAPELMLEPDGLYDTSVDMWSVGCIFAELLGRKALFPGKNFLHQLTLIFDVLGTPSVDTTARLKSAQAQRFLKSLGKKTKVSLRTLFPTASPDALDLLDRLLTIDPAQRISARDALAHPYLEAIERKARTADPTPTARVDFGFDVNRALTKLDLRALILKEVERFRRSVAASAGSSAGRVDSDCGRDDDDRREREQASRSSSDATPPAARSAKLGKTAAVATAALPPGSSSTQTARVMCGAAGTSMINSLLRQPLPTTLGSEDAQPLPTSNTVISATTATTAMIGSNRQRIRMTSKPPVPRQLGVSNQQLDQQQHQQQGRVMTYTATGSSALAAMLTVEAVVAESQVAAFATSATGTATTATTAWHTTAASPTPASEVASVAVEQPLPAKPTTRPTSASAISNAGPSGSTDSARAIAAAIALGERSKALISALTKPSATESSATHRPNDMSSHTSTSTTHNSICLATSGTRNPECSSSSSSSSSSDSDDDSKRVQSAFRHRPTAHDSSSSSSSVSGLPRRAASAGPVRTRSALAPVGTGTSNTSSTPTPAVPTAAFVGTTNSLMRAQRVSNGQTLAESANQMLSALTNTGSDPTESLVFAAPVQSSLLLRSQRSVSQLPQQQAQSQQAQPAVDTSVAKRLPKSRLTVPKSPKFSVMSWQKKRSGVLPMRPRSAAAASTTTTATAATESSIATTSRR